MASNDVLSKEEVRGKRSIKNKTVKRTPPAFDEDKNAKGWHRNHARLQPAEFDASFDDLDEMYPEYDWRKMLK